MKNMKEIKMRRVPQVVLYLLFAGCAFCAHASEQLNIILLMTDDQDYYDLGHHGNPDIETPTLDRFASEALTMHRFYVSLVLLIPCRDFSHRPGRIDPSVDGDFPSQQENWEQRTLKLTRRNAPG